MREADNFRPSLVRIIILHAFAALLATTVTFKLPDAESAWEKSRWIISFAELLPVSYALWMGWRSHRKHAQERWIRCRFATKLVRGLRSSIPLLDPLQPLVTRHDPKWRRFALRVGLLVLEHQPTEDPLRQQRRQRRSFDKLAADRSPALLKKHPEKPNERGVLNLHRPVNSLAHRRDCGFVPAMVAGQQVSVTRLASTPSSTSPPIPP